jgi:hypothetical protein
MITSEQRTPNPILLGRNTSSEITEASTVNQGGKMWIALYWLQVDVRRKHLNQSLLGIKGGCSEKEQHNEA